MPYLSVEKFMGTTINLLAIENMHIESKLPLRVLFISHAYVVGVNQGKLNAILETGNIEVGLLAPSNWKSPEWDRPLPLEKPYPKLCLYAAPVAFTGKGGAHFYNPWDLWRVLNEFKPDILQVEEEVFSLSTFEIALYSRAMKIPMVVFGWENQERRLPLPRWWLSQFVLNTAQALIPGNHDGANLMHNWGYKGLLEVMPQIGVDPVFFSAPKPSDTTKPLEQPFNIGFLGRLDYSKGIDLLFAAADQLRELELDFRITVCGSGSEEAKLKQIAENLSIADLIFWRGAVRHEQVPTELRNFDVLVLPSRTTSTWKEQFGHVLIEAMAMGIPVIGSSSGEIPNVIGRSDLVFEEGNFGELAEVLKRMILHPEWRNEISEYGLHRVQDQYSHACIAERLISLWKRVINKK
jgi:glycosyltransferase involved in cell wall biosynthesis